MKMKRISLKPFLFAVGVCTVLGLAGCSGQPATSTPADVNAFAGNPNSPEAKAAAQTAVAADAQRAAAARAAAQSQKAPPPKP